MTENSKPGRIRLIMAGLLLAVLLAALIAPLRMVELTWLVACRFLTGFGRFLAHNVPAISPNAATWVPGVAAFVIGAIITHGCLAGPLRARFSRWSFRQTLALALVIPILFATAFIVPGILLHAVPLAKEPWFQVGER
jgi:MFS family permease